VKKQLIIISFVLFSAAFSGIAFSDNIASYRNAKALGMGDTKVAGGFGYNGFVNNPALLTRTPVFRISVLNLPITANKNIVDIADFINDNKDNFENYDKLTLEEKQTFVKDLQKYDSKWGRMNVSPMFDVSVNIADYAVGLAVFNNLDFGLKMDRGIYEPRVWGEGFNNSAVVLGFAKPLSMFVPGLTVGANLKYMERRHANLFQIAAHDLGNLSDTIKPITDQAKESKEKVYAMDIGGIYDLPLIGSEVAATYQSLGDGRNSSLDFGIAKRMYSNNLTLLADYVDLFDNNKENVFKKLHFGAEYKYLYFALRAGVNAGYPTVGLGLDFRVIDIDAAYFSDELTKGPGGEAEKLSAIQIKMGW
jgi:hypothetical protein